MCQDLFAENKKFWEDKIMKFVWKVTESDGTKL